jgi:2'-5' RNA ligase
MTTEATIRAKGAPASEWRLFVGAPVSSAVREASEAMCGRLRPFGDVKWVSSERLHLTLKFLGNMPPEKVPQLKEILQEVANNCLHFVLSLDRIGAFPKVSHPQTVWYGVGGETDALSNLAHRIEEALVPLGFASEGRPFRGHVTLGRVRSSRGMRELATELEKRAADSPPGIEWLVDSIALIRSELKPSGPTYTELSRFSLATLPAGEQEQESR